LSRITSNKGLNSNEALDESTATSSSVMLSGARRVKEAPDGLDIWDYSTDPGNSDSAARSRFPISMSPARRALRPGRHPDRGTPVRLRSGQAMRYPRPLGPRRLFLSRVVDLPAFA